MTGNSVRHEDIAELAGVLRSDHATSSQLYQAAKALDEEGSPEAIEVLVSLFDNPNYDNSDASLGHFAGRALVALGPSGLDRALAVFGDERQPVRCVAAEALSEIGGPRAEAALVAHLENTHEDGLVRELSAEALLRMRGESAGSVLAPYLTGEDEDIRDGLTTELATHPAAWAAQPLTENLRTGRFTWSNREHLAEALAAVAGPEQLPGLIKVLESGNSDAREIAVSVLSDIDADAVLRALPAIVRVAASGAQSVRAAAARLAADLAAKVPGGLDPESALIVDAAQADAPDEVMAALAGKPGSHQFAGGGTALMWAAAHESTRVAARLIDLGAEVDRTNPGSSHGTALMLAAQNGSTEVARLLLDAGAAVDLRLDPPSRQTALNVACGAGHAAIVDLLVEHGANVNDTDANMTPLIQAAASQHLDVTRLLLAAGADVRLCNADGTDALTLVFASRVVGMAGGIPVAPEEADTAAAAQLLLDAGADANHANTAGQTALMMAARLGHAEACRLLIAAGADPTRVDADGDNAAAWARLNHHDELAAELSPTPRRRVEPPAPSTHAQTLPEDAPGLPTRSKRWWHRH